eukprot:PhF_6_TR40706/c0_g1_i1/m.61201
MDEVLQRSITHFEYFRKILFYKAPSVGGGTTESDQPQPRWLNIYAMDTASIESACKTLQLECYLRFGIALSSKLSLDTTSLINFLRQCLLEIQYFTASGTQKQIMKLTSGAVHYNAIHMSFHIPCTLSGPEVLGSLFEVLILAYRKFLVDYGSVEHHGVTSNGDEGEDPAASFIAMDALLNKFVVKPFVKAMTSQCRAALKFTQSDLLNVYFESYLERGEEELRKSIGEEGMVSLGPDEI